MQTVGLAFVATFNAASYDLKALTVLSSLAIFSSDPSKETILVGNGAIQIEFDI